MSPLAGASLATRAIHEDMGLAGAEVAANISLSTTFRHPDPAVDGAEPGYADDWDASNPSRDVYARETKPTTTRAEHVLSSIIGQPTILYPSGMAAFWAILLHVRPDVIAITGGYGGCHEAIKIYRRTRGEDQVDLIKLDDDFPSASEKKLLVWVETPLNPTGESRSLDKYAKKAHDHGGLLGVDSTFGPPPLQDPFKWGADIVMHSGTKYFNGHSDVLAGTVSVRDKADWHKLWNDRTFTGANIGSLDVWLLLRSLRTLDVRVRRQSKTATRIAQWLATQVGGGVVDKVHHAALQENAEDLLGPGKQMELGPACFSVVLSSKEIARALPNKLRCFIHATSLGGVESLIEHRIISDPSENPCLVRLSIGLEDFDDLKADWEQAMQAVRQ